MSLSALEFARPSADAWRVEVAHGRVGRARRLAKSFENTTASASGWLQVACLMLVLRVRDGERHWPRRSGASGRTVRCSDARGEPDCLVPEVVVAKQLGVDVDAVRPAQHTEVWVDVDTMPPVWIRARDEIAKLQRECATKKKYSRSWRTLNRRIARLHSKASRVADNWARETARQIVDRSDVVVLEDLKLANMVRSAKGTVEEPGTNVAAKAALNRKMSEAALGRLRHRICTRAEEAGCRVWVVPAQHTSQTCPSCGHVGKENRATQARFECVECGHADHADVNAAVNIAARGATAEAAWRSAGAPSLVRPKARLQRRKEPPPVVPLAA